MSKYLNPSNTLQRLREDWDKHGGIIVSVDFDSTLVPYMEDEKAYIKEFEKIRQLVRELHSFGCTIVINTASAESRWEGIKEELNTLAIPYDYFNETPPNVPNVGKHGKVYANVYLDDRAGLSEVFNHLQQLLTEKKLELAVKQQAALMKAFD